MWPSTNQADAWHTLVTRGTPPASTLVSAPTHRTGRSRWLLYKLLACGICSGGPSRPTPAVGQEEFMLVPHTAWKKWFDSPPDRLRASDPSQVRLHKPLCTCRLEVVL